MLEWPSLSQAKHNLPDHSPRTHFGGVGPDYSFEREATYYAAYPHIRPPTLHFCESGDA